MHAHAHVQRRSHDDAYWRTSAQHAAACREAGQPGTRQTPSAPDGDGRSRLHLRLLRRRPHGLRARRSSSSGPSRRRFRMAAVVDLLSVTWSVH
ncbi:hypothetical protein HBB16_03735 [Pseudonocardia sp. MCCB 268]|nr:hypothetical protein [Pseudonocardia cytotoxica]